MPRVDWRSYNEQQHISILRLLIISLMALTVWTCCCNTVQAVTLQDYVEEALENNLALKQQNMSYEKSRAVLAEVRGAFLPSLDFSTRYTRAGGGRTIETPIGDLVNPIHGTLNQLLGEARFPTDLPNITTYLLREEEQETKISLTQPLFQAEIYYNQKSKANMSRASEASRDRYARELVADVKTAYYNYSKATEVVRLLTQTEELLNENLRVSESLVRNDKVTTEVVYRAQAELSELKQQQAEADRVLDLARAYFNFLLNRPLTDSIVLEENSVVPQPLDELESVQASAGENRDELRQLMFTQRGLGDLVNLAKGSFIPGVYLSLDYGFEGEKYNFDSDHDFWTASVVLKWNLFNGFSDKSRVRQYKLEKESIAAKTEEVRRQIDMEARNAHHAVEVALRRIEAAADRLMSARQSFTIVERKYAEGLSPQIEYLQARTFLTEAEINHINVQQDYRIALAELERVTASYPLNAWR